MASPTAERLKAGRKTLAVFMDAAQAFEDDQVQPQLQEAEEHRETCDRRLRVALTHLLLDEKLYRDFAGEKVVDVRQHKKLERVESKALEIIDGETRRLERALIPPDGRIKTPGSG